MRQADCSRNCWIGGAISGLVVVLFASGFGDVSFLGGLFLGLITTLLMGGMLVWLLCEGASADYDPSAGLTPPAADPTPEILRRAQPMAQPAAVSPAAVSPIAVSPVAVSPVAVSPVAVSPVAVVTAEPVEAKGETPQSAPVTPEPPKREAVSAEVLTPENRQVVASRAASNTAEAAKPARTKAEPKAESAKAKSAPAGKAADKPARSAGDDLKKISGIGPRIEAALNELGVTQYREIAAWDAEAVARYTKDLGRRGARIESDDWVGQARELAGVLHG